MYFWSYFHLSVAFFLTPASRLGSFSPLTVAVLEETAA
jgi:hypothetical protein